jgi:hypothetical protein
MRIIRTSPVSSSKRRYPSAFCARKRTSARGAETSEGVSSASGFSEVQAVDTRAKSGWTSRIVAPYPCGAERYDACPRSETSAPFSALCATGRNRNRQAVSRFHQKRDGRADRFEDISGDKKPDFSFGRMNVDIDILRRETQKKRPLSRGIMADSGDGGADDRSENIRPLTYASSCILLLSGSGRRQASTEALHTRTMRNGCPRVPKRSQGPFFCPLGLRVKRGFPLARQKKLDFRVCDRVVRYDAVALSKLGQGCL